MLYIRYMTITWYGHSCFKILGAGGQLTIITDPFDKQIGLNPPRGVANIVTVSHDHNGHNNIQALSGEPFVIDGPGEYGTKGAEIKGISSSHDDQGKVANTIYVINVDNIKTCHLGDLGQERLTDKQVEAIGSIDVLMVPVGGRVTIGASQAAKIIEQIEPRLVIPMHYKLPGLKIELTEVDTFLGEMGIKGKEAVDKLTLKKKDLVGEKTDVVIMKL